MSCARKNVVEIVESLERGALRLQEFAVGHPPGEQLLLRALVDLAIAEALEHHVQGVDLGAGPVPVQYEPQARSATSARRDSRPGFRSRAPRDRHTRTASTCRR